MNVAILLGRVAIAGSVAGATAGLWIAHETRRSEHPRDGGGSELVRTAIDALTLTGATACGAAAGAALALTSPVWLAHRAVCWLRSGRAPPNQKSAL